MKTFAFSTVAFSLLLLDAPAAIVYTEGFGNKHGDGWPDRGSYVQDIDLDGDGAYDYYFRGGARDFLFVPVRDSRILTVMAIPPDLGSYTVGFEAGAMIGSSPIQTEWWGTADAISEYQYGPVVMTMVTGYTYSTIPADEVRYFGLELHREDGVHYGWIAVETKLIHNNWLDVKGWAYESEPGKPILAGVIPEPSSLLLLAGGTVALAFGRRCRRS